MRKPFFEGEAKRYATEKAEIKLAAEKLERESAEFDEKSEAQTFLDHFFRALGHAGAMEAGATFEFRIAKKPGSPQLELITTSDVWLDLDFA